MTSARFHRRRDLPDLAAADPLRLEEWDLPVGGRAYLLVSGMRHVAFALTVLADPVSGRFETGRALFERAAVHACRDALLDAIPRKTAIFETLRDLGLFHPRADAFAVDLYNLHPIVWGLRSPSVRLGSDRSETAQDDPLAGRVIPSDSNDGLCEAPLPDRVRMPEAWPSVEPTVYWLAPDVTAEALRSVRIGPLKDTLGAWHASLRSAIRPPAMPDLASFE